MSSDRGKLGNFLKEVIDWRWDEFCRAEKDSNFKYTGYESAVFSLVRTCSDGKLGAMKLAIDRVDGKLETPIKVEYPKIWFLYPHAKTVGELPEGESQELAPPSIDELPDPQTEEQPESAATLSLREMVQKMADQPREVVPLILAAKRWVESELAAGRDPQDSEMVEKKIPMVKSVIAANLLHLAIEKNNFDAITEVFDQIDGKLVETLRILGDDIYLPQYTLEAPYGAVKNKDGIYMLEAKEITSQWQQKLESKRS